MSIPLRPTLAMFFMFRAKEGLSIPKRPWKSGTSSRRALRSQDSLSSVFSSISEGRSLSSMTDLRPKASSTVTFPSPMAMETLESIHLAILLTTSSERVLILSQSLSFISTEEDTGLNAFDSTMDWRRMGRSTADFFFTISFPPRANTLLSSHLAIFIISRGL